MTNNGGYGLWLVTGSSASVSYSGFSGNKLGSIKGSPIEGRGQHPGGGLPVDDAVEQLVSEDLDQVLPVHRRGQRLAGRRSLLGEAPSAGDRPRTAGPDPPGYASAVHRPRPTRRRGVVIAWMPVSQRSTTIADRLGYDLVLVGRSGFRRAWTAPFAYPLSAVRTMAALVRLRPRAAIIAVPPFVAPLVAWPFLAVLRAPFAVDVHSGAVLDRRWRWSLGLVAAVARSSVAAIVTLPTLEPPFRDRGAPTLVIPDPLPDVSTRDASDDDHPLPVGGRHRRSSSRSAAGAWMSPSKRSSPPPRDGRGSSS